MRRVTIDRLTMRLPATAAADAHRIATAIAREIGSRVANEPSDVAKLHVRLPALPRKG